MHNELEEKDIIDDKLSKSNENFDIKESLEIETNKNNIGCNLNNNYKLNKPKEKVSKKISKKLLFLILIILVVIIMSAFFIVFILNPKDKSNQTINQEIDKELIEGESQSEGQSINLENQPPESEETIVLSDSELYDKLDELMITRNYNSYAINVIKSFIPDYQKLFTNNEIYDLFLKVSKITLNPYDPANPNLSKTDRAYNAGGNIVVNCFEGELDNNKNWDGLKWLLTHEIIHSLGDFPSTYIEGSFELSIYNRNSLLEEGLADSIAHFVKGTQHNNKFALKKQDDFMMYRVEDDYTINENFNATHTYTFSGNVISIFKYIGCYDEIIHSNINGNFDELKVCMSKNVKDGEKYFYELFKLINQIYLYTEYPNTFNSKEVTLQKYKEYEINQQNDLIDFISNNNLNDLVIKYSVLASTIINNKIDNSYSICEFYKNNIIFYSEDGKTYKKNLTCNE